MTNVSYCDRYAVFLAFELAVYNSKYDLLSTGYQTSSNYIIMQIQLNFDISYTIDMSK